MNPRLRTLAFTILLIGLSSLVLFQALQTSVASVGHGFNVGLMSGNVGAPLQTASPTGSSQSLSANATAQNTNATTSSQTTPALALNSTSQTSSSTENETTAISYLQYQMNSMNDQLVAMSSSMNSINQQTGMNTLIAEAGLIIGILAIIGVIAVARRGDAMYRGASQNEPPGPPAPKK